MRQGFKCGYGVYLYANGNSYEGEWLSDKKTGKGIYHNIANNEKYEGQYLDNEKHGYGTFFYKYGDKFSGEWVNGNKHGNGTFTFQNGTVIEGKWQDDKLNGPGKIRYNNGDCFEGKLNPHLFTKLLIFITIVFKIYYLGFFLKGEKMGQELINFVTERNMRVIGLKMKKMGLVHIPT